MRGANLIVWAVAVLVAGACAAGPEAKRGRERNPFLDQRREMATKALAAKPPDRTLLRRALENIGHVSVYYVGKQVEAPAEGTPTVTTDGKHHLTTSVALDREERGAAPDAWIEQLLKPLDDGFAPRHVLLAVALPADTGKLRDRMLADGDVKLREGLRDLAKTFPQLRRTSRRTLERRIQGRSAKGTISLYVCRSHRVKGGSDAPVGERDRYVFIVGLRPLRGSGGQQMVTFHLYPHLALIGQIQVSAGDPKLEAALKKLLADALAPLDQLSRRARAHDLASERPRERAE